MTDAAPPPVQQLADLLRNHRWHTDPLFPDLVEPSAHANHHYDNGCAVCVGDVDRIAAAVGREVRRLTAVAHQASRHARVCDAEVAEQDATLAARGAEVARLNAREARTQVELHDLRHALGEVLAAIDDGNRIQVQDQPDTLSVRTGWLPVSTVDRWRALLGEDTPTADPHPLPGWVTDLVRGLVRYDNEHPQLYRYWGADPAGGAEYRLTVCPCTLLEGVPAEVRAQAEKPEG